MAVITTFYKKDFTNLPKTREILYTRNNTDLLVHQKKISPNFFLPIHVTFSKCIEANIDLYTFSSTRLKHLLML